MGIKLNYTNGPKLGKLVRKHFTFLITGVLCSIFLIFSMIANSVKEKDFAKSYEAIKYFEKLETVDTGSFFFVEISGNPYLSLRAACAIESVASHNPSASVTLYNRSRMAEDDTLTTLLQLPNFRLAPLNLKKIFLETPLAQWYQDSVFERSLYPVIKLSDATRYALLWNLGGVYLDTDVIVLRPFAGLRNAVGLEHLFGVNNAVMVFDRHSHVLWTVMQEFLRVYSPYKWGAEGPGLLNRVLHLLCANRTSYFSLLQPLSEFVMDPDACRGVHLLPVHAFYPVAWPVWPQLFSVISDHRRLIGHSYAVHLWNSLSKGRHSALGSKDLLDVLARENCPTVYRKVLVPMGVGL